jgi:hypothetical protein
MSDPFEEFIDSVMEADFEVDDIKRVINDIETGQSNGIDRLDSEKLLAEFCSLRYKYAFIYIAFNAIHQIAKPKSDYKSNLKHIRRAINLLAMLKREMENLQNAMEEGSEDGPEE